MFACHFLHERHKQHIVVNSQISLFKYRSNLKLVRCYLVVTSLTRNGKLKSLYFQVFHKRLHSIRNSTEIVVFHLLILGRIVSHKCTSGKHKVRSCTIESLVNQEIFLFPTKVRRNLLYIVIKIMTHICCSHINGM